MLSLRSLIHRRHAALVTAIALIFCARTVVAGPAVSRRAPSLVLPAREGKVVLESFRGRIVYLDFWASWCAPCRASFPWMAKLAKEHAEDSLVVIAVNLDKERSLADAFLVQHPAPFVVVFDPAGQTAESFQVRAMPTSLLIGRDGSILWRHSGFDPRQAPDLERRVKEALLR